MRCRVTGYIEARITRSRSMEEHAPSGPAVIYYGAVMKTLELGSRATEPQPCLSPHLKYTINMLKTRPELSEIATFPLPSCADKERVARPVFNSLVTRLVKASCLDPRILSRIPRLSREFSQITAKHHPGSLSKISKFFEKVSRDIRRCSFVETRDDGTGPNIGGKIDFPPSPRPIASTIIERN